MEIPLNVVVLIRCELNLYTMIDNIRLSCRETESNSLSLVEEASSPLCSHCGKPLSRTEIPVEAAYGTDYFWVCFADDCPYFIRGWAQMWDNYSVRASYRFRINPVTGKEGSLPVWSPDAMKSRIKD
ncbi:MAG: hypothetical protein V2A61_00445 [Calditrichota bacterium]